jgi:hypothetical protein
VNLLSENKRAKYLIYAIGEVLIVIIGILIAIQIDNWNQQRQAEIKINHLLLEILNNLDDEIESAKRGIEFYNYKDTLITRVIERKVKREEFNSEPLSATYENQHPQYATFAYAGGYSLNKNAYNNLVQISDRIPKKYSVLYSNVTYLYEDINDLVREREKKLLDNYYPCQNYLRDNKYFMSDLWAAKPLDDEAIDFFMYDPIYLNWVYVLQHYYEYHQRSFRAFVDVATEVKNQIEELKLKDY